MSDKLNYFTVTSESIVKARNKADAAALAGGRRNMVGQVLSRETEIDRVTAVDARQKLSANA